MGEVFGLDGVGELDKRRVTLFPLIETHDKLLMIRVSLVLATPYYWPSLSPSYTLHVTILRYTNWLPIVDRQAYSSPVRLST